MPRGIRKEAEESLLQALVCGATVENAARKAGVSERTAYRRRNDPKFCQRLAELRLEMIQRTVGMLTGAGLVSVKTLVDLQQDVAVGAAVRRHAARDVLEMGLKLRDHAEVAARLAAVEERLARALAGEDSPMDKAVE
jgi:hypothetical protein